MDFNSSVWSEIHVLVVDQDPVTLVEIANLLHQNSYTVTTVHDPSVASSMLTTGDTKYDLVMVDVNASDSQGYQLLHHATNMNVTVIAMSANATPEFMMSAIEDGAFLCIEKPATVDVLKLTWQYVLREKKRKGIENMRCNKNEGEGSNQDNLNREITTKKNGKNNRKTRQKGIVIKENTVRNPGANNAHDQRIKPKHCTGWTLELHHKFKTVVRELGEGKCFPKDIMELMNVPGLTRMQVASHLQRCRAGWIHPEERDSTTPKVQKASNKSRSKSYGLFPRTIEGFENLLPVEVHEHGTSGISVGVKDPTDFPGQLNIEQQHGILSNNNNVNEIPNENLHGVAASNHDLPFSDFAFDFANEDLQDFNMDELLPGQDFNGDGDDEGSWNEWISSLANDADE